MRVFAIKNEYDEKEPVCAYLLYYEISRRFFIEITDNCDEWDVPVFLSSFVKRNIRTVSQKWSRVWVRQRIVPTDRQNLGQILRENGLKSYDEFDLLMLSSGRCAQDDYFLTEISEEMLPFEIKKRRKKLIEDAVALEDNTLLVFFCDGAVKKIRVDGFTDKNPKLRTLFSARPDVFKSVKLQTGGYELYWDENTCISCYELYESGRNVPLTLDDFRAFAECRIITAAEAAEELGCSRQNIDDLVKRGKLKTVKKTEKTTLFLKSDVLKREWK